MIVLMIYNLCMMNNDTETNNQSVQGWLTIKTDKSVTRLLIFMIRCHREKDNTHTETATRRQRHIQLHTHGHTHTPTHLHTYTHTHTHTHTCGSAVSGHMLYRCIVSFDVGAPAHATPLSLMSVTCPLLFL